MIRISNIKLPPGYTDADIRQALKKERIPSSARWEISRLSLDARKKDRIHYLCTLEAGWPGDSEFLRQHRSPNLTLSSIPSYVFPSRGELPLACRPVIVGAGPAGLFAARVLAEAGYRPLVIERGAPVEERAADVGKFWKEGRLNPESNVQFGEGGAGTFSDGKLMTQIRDREGRIRQMLSWFVEAGADPSILYWSKPHIGTDTLKTVVRNLREMILSLGGEFRFHCRLEELLTDQEGRLCGIRIMQSVKDGSGKIQKEEEVLEASVLLLCPGHSARDTFRMLERLHVPLESKAFAVGLRVEHPQKEIDQAQYGRKSAPDLPVADYKLTGTAPDGRGVFSFCMCPGGQVVNASSEDGCLAVNGMSCAARDGRNANAALVVSVSPSDYPGDSPLAGIAFQQELEKLAWEAGEGHIPVQLLGDFCKNTVSRILGEVEPDLCGSWEFANLRSILPEPVRNGLLAALPAFGQKIRGFDRDDAVFSGVESRTSSPVRILRDEHFESTLKGLFPCGEGAGYAGGITSAAVDGMKTAEEIIRRFRLPD